MAILGIGSKKTTIIGNSYAPGQTYNPENMNLSGTWDDLYNNQANLRYNANGALAGKVNTDPSSMEYTAEQQTAINNNKNLKDTQKRLNAQGSGAQQTVLGGRGY